MSLWIWLPDVDPATDPCVAAPLSFTVTRWPSGAAGSHRLEYAWSGTGPPTVTFTPKTATATNTAGCSRTVTKP